MALFVRICTGIMLAFSAISQAEIIPVNDIKVLHQYARSDTLILTDIDETLLEPTMQVASAHWGEYVRNAIDKSSVTQEQAGPILNLHLGCVKHHVPMQPMQEDTAQVIKQLQEKKMHVLGLTARPKHSTNYPNYDRLTRDHLKTLDIDFTLSALPAELSFNEAEGGIWSYCYGVIFTGKIPKGTSLVAFLKHYNYKPSRVVLIDDRLPQLQSMEAALAEAGIEFVGLHYLQASKPWDAAIANIQWHALLTTGVVPGDAEAEKIKERFPERNPDFMLNYFIDSIKVLNID